MLVTSSTRPPTRWESSVCGGCEWKSECLSQLLDIFWHFFPARPLVKCLSEQMWEYIRKTSQTESYFNGMCGLINFLLMWWFLPTTDSLSQVWALTVFVCVCWECVSCMCGSSPQTRRSRSLPLVSWCPLISWCCRGFQNDASGGGISSHCHDNDSDTLAPSNSDQPIVWKQECNFSCSGNRQSSVRVKGP